MRLAAPNWAAARDGFRDRQAVKARIELKGPQDTLVADPLGSQHRDIAAFEQDLAGACRIQP